MIPRLSQVETTEALYLDFIDALKLKGFMGDLNPDYANRIVLSTDNSIYQMLPQGVLYPRSAEDLVLISTLADESRFAEVKLSARGGGTGTNGQSLTDGLIVDVSKHMNTVLEINEEERWVRVQSGVVKDQLNRALKPYGLFFAPELSTSNRATVGGMINTDASGQGSVMYGKTRDHVLELNSVLLGGEQWCSKPLSDDELAEIKQREDRIGEVHRLVDNVFTENKDLIDQKFPKLNRCLTGYDLAHIRDENGQFNLNSVLCGGEGSLAFITEAKLNVLPIPKFAALVNIKYDSFESSLRDATDLMEWNPTSIETIDSKVLNLAMGDIIWDTVSAYFPSEAGEAEIQGINLVEYTSDDEQALKADVEKLEAHLKAVAGQAGKSFGFSVVYGSAEIGKVWAMRKKAVGLLGNAKGQERPIPFVEDTAVPPENLADFIMEFRKVLDDRGLAYGMFGHVDAGVLHVRPAVDMKDTVQESLIREVTDQVVALTVKYNGLLWGEHGKGVRSEYSPEFFGELYPQLQKIKAGFDPRNQMNPGKIATPAIDGAELLKIDQVPTRGQFDRQISGEVREEYDSAMFCNGNGACFNYDPNDAMCPSWKGTRQRIHSPKGRSSLIREWLRLVEKTGTNLKEESRKVKNSSFLMTLPSRIKNTLAKRKGEDYDFSDEVHESMMACLACKSCVGQCPIKVNVPDFRARFLEVYYGRYLRPAKDYMVGSLEYMIPWLSKFPAPYNWAMKNRALKGIFRKHVGMVDSPTICTNSLISGMKARGVAFATPKLIESLRPEDRENAVIIVQDAFTSYFETQLVLDLVDLLTGIGCYVLMAPFKPNGKPLHVHGFMKIFQKAAESNGAMLKALDNTGVPLIGIDPSMTLTYRQEYGYVIPDKDLPKVQLLQEWLVTQKPKLEAYKMANTLSGEFKLLAHCTEKTSAAPSIRLWQDIYKMMGQTLDIQAVGCCGMSGTYGHETQNFETSINIYQLSWSEVINNPENKDKLVATGYSCRSQVKRMDEQEIPHPVQTLLRILRTKSAKN
ncbi:MULTISPECIES: FAD-binding and (Fe-S)-binding domain-containing protein [unclassified Neptuniibacter]|uniref:D-2-hydroxyglutarate dehydrogenase YdiJ n=1 Tax=unclassified Neptuniibacter TaxID=2630693 RepID=UPI000C4E9D0C|nr:MULTISPECIES: FAD-binding and (Fe-S)-binding domain-containing protein [unclassified Neptuniibacter]MAY43576.1 FAD-binding oxidoreductase [Oceanospirillaceae bacterium]|tara:strand:- start:30533 stop:33613 length:3081 start_codon:yes stop_codon:yes gene_type:complete